MLNSVNNEIKQTFQNIFALKTFPVELQKHCKCIMLCVDSVHSYDVDRSCEQVSLVLKFVAFGLLHIVPHRYQEQTLKINQAAVWFKVCQKLINYFVFAFMLD